jgi:hypothetical protein
MGTSLLAGAMTVLLATDVWAAAMNITLKDTIHYG